MPIKHANFATSTIATVGGILAGDTTVDVQPGDGALFPTLAAGEYFYAVLVDGSGTREIVKCTARDTDALTIVRAQQGTSAAAFSADDVIELRVTKGMLEDMATEAGTLIDEDNMASNSATSTPSQQSVKAFVESLLTGYTKRSKFVYNGAATAYTIKVGAGRYMVKDKIAQWGSELTTTAIAMPAANTWYYLYLDYSAITSGTAITATELIWASTAPTYSHVLGGWYNGDDLCIFAVRSNEAPDNIYVFYHDGGELVARDGFFVEADEIQPGATWKTVNMASSMPVFSTRGLCTFNHVYVDYANYVRCRPKGSAGNGVIAAYVNADSIRSVDTQQVFTDADRIMEVRVGIGTANTNKVTVYNMGFFLSGGI